MISKSSQRHTFQLENAIKRAEEKGENVDPNYIEMWENIKLHEVQKEHDPDWQKNNLEYDLRTTEWILEKVRNSDKYAQNLYASMCNREFIKNDVWPILTEQKWSCSWRHAGGVIADMKQEGDYINWYCSGIGDGLGNGDKDRSKGYVSEGVVTDEIREDLLKLGWIVLDDEGDIDV